MADGIQRVLLAVKKGSSFLDALQEVRDETERVFIASWILHTQGRPVTLTAVSNLLSSNHNWFSNASPETCKERREAFTAMKEFLDGISAAHENVTKLQDELTVRNETISKLRTALEEATGFDEMCTSLYGTMQERDNARIIEEMRHREPANLQREKRLRRQHMRSVPDLEEDS